MRISPAGIRLIASFEGLAMQLYDDPGGHCTIGYGHLVHLGNCDGRASEQPFRNGLSAARARGLLTRDVRTYEAHVSRLVTVPLTQNEFDALVSFTYNVGGAGLETSTVLHAVNLGQHHQVPTLLARYVHAVGGTAPLPGLVRRRWEEGELYATPQAPPPPAPTDAQLLHATSIFQRIALDFARGKLEQTAATKSAVRYLLGMR